MNYFEIPKMGKPTQISEDEMVLSTPVWSYLRRDFRFDENTIRTFHTISKGPGVTIVPWATSGQHMNILDHELFVIPQVRPNANLATGYCFPAGGVDPVDNGSVIACAKRELEEEAGLLAYGLVDLGAEYTSVHFSDNQNQTVLAYDLVHTDTAHEDTERIGTVRRYTIGELNEMTQTISPEGAPYFYDGISIAGLGKAALYIAAQQRSNLQ